MTNNHNNQGNTPDCPLPVEGADNAASPAPTLLMGLENPVLQAKVFSFMRNIIYIPGFHIDQRSLGYFATLGQAVARKDLVSAIQTKLPPADLLALQNYTREQDRLVLENDSTEEMIRILWNERRSNKKIAEFLYELLTQNIASCAERAKKLGDGNRLQQKFDELAAVFHLDEAEVNMLWIAYLRQNRIWEPYMRLRGIPATRNDRIQILSVLIRQPISVCEEKLSNTGRLRRMECIDGDLDLLSGVDRYLSGISSDPISSNYYTLVTQAALPWAMHGELASTHGEAIKALIAARNPERCCNILLYGEPGTGKTTFAISLAAELGLSLYRIKKNDESQGHSIFCGPSSPLAAVNVCADHIDPDKSLILVDEADEILRSQSSFAAIISGGGHAGGDKGSVNTVLDILRVACIWITNIAPEEMHESIRRRFDYSIKFNPPDKQRRVQIWKNVLAINGLTDLIAERTVVELVDRYALSTGSIERAVQNCARMVQHRGKIAAAGRRRLAVQVLEQLLRPQCELLGIPVSGKRNRVSRQYSIEGLNVRGQGLAGDLPVARLLETLRKYCRNTKSDFGARADDVTRMTILLYGPPGTGKSEFVKHLGEQTGRPVHIKMGSDLLDRFVGGTERNIRNAFSAAEAERAILFIDEADGMLCSRRRADHNWQVTQVNELLQGMEKFDGVLVCATNAFEMLDTAAIRRFTFKLEFNYLLPDGVRQFYQRMLANLCDEPLPPSAASRLTRLENLAPGDFYTVRQQFRSSGEAGVSHEMLIEALNHESSAKNQNRPNCDSFGFRGGSQRA